MQFRPLLWLPVLLACQLVTGAQAQNAGGAAALSGQVSSTEEGAMEGVLVNARRDRSTITVTVVSDQQGRYSFPADRLDPGKYTLSIRAAGYDLDGPQSVDVAAGGSSADIKLVKTKNLANQLSNAEWMNSVPGSDKLKATMLRCVGCHTLQRVFTSKHTAVEWPAIFRRMGTYSPGSVPTAPQPLLPGPRGERPPFPQSQYQAVAEWLGSVDLSSGNKPDYALKTLPRPKGAATKVIITEYDLPRKEAQPHDVIVDADGMAWYSDFGSQFAGILDPKTGKATDIALPVLRPEQPKGGLDIEFDPEGNAWVSMMYQSGIVRIDRKTHEVKAYPFPKELLSANSNASMVSPQHADVDGKVWTNNQEMHASYRVDIKTGAYENLGVSKDASGKQVSGYGMPTDAGNNLYLLQMAGAEIGRVDAKTKAVEIYSTPRPNTAPRRGSVDAQNRLWFGEYGGNAIGMFDPKTKTMREWQLPTAWGAPYDAVLTKTGEAWTGSMVTDLVSRLDVESEKYTEYLLPRPTNIRRVFVQETGPRPVLWIGSNHGASIIKVEPLN
jgi:streptogramin lyase